MATRQTTTIQTPPAPAKDQDPYKFNLSVKQIIDKWSGNAGLLDMVVTFRDLQNIAAGSFEFTNIRSLSKIQYIDGGVVRTGRITSYDTDTYFDLDYDKIVMNGKIEYTSTVAGIFLGRDGTAYKVNIGDSSEYFKWDGTNLTWQGANAELTSTGALRIASGTVGPSTGARIFLDGTNLRVSVYDASDNEKTASGYVNGLLHNPIKGFAVASFADPTVVNDTSQNWTVNALAGLLVTVVAGTGIGQAAKTIASNTATSFTVSVAFSPALDGTSQYSIAQTATWGASDYGFWAAPGDHLVIDGDVQHDSGDFIIQHDANYLIKDYSDNIIVRMGTDKGEKGLFNYTSTGVLLSKFTGSQLYMGADGETGNYIKYTPAGGMLIHGNVTIAGNLSSISSTTGALTVNGNLSVGANIILGNSGAIYTVNKTTYADTDAGFFLGYDTDAHKLNIGDATHYLKWTGTALNIKGIVAVGSITLDTSGYICTDGKTSYADTDAGVFIGYDSIEELHVLNIGDATNYVKWDGANMILSDDIIVTDHVTDDNITRSWGYSSESNVNINEYSTDVGSDLAETSPIAYTSSITYTANDYFLQLYAENYLASLDNTSDAVLVFTMFFEAIEIVKSGILKWTYSAALDDGTYYLTDIAGTASGLGASFDPGSTPGMLSGGLGGTFKVFYEDDALWATLAEAEFGYGDKEVPALGFDTIYAHLVGGGDPDAQADGYLQFCWLIKTFSSPTVTGYGAASNVAKINTSPAYNRILNANSNTSLNRGFVVGALYNQNGLAAGSRYCDSVDFIVWERKK